MSSTEQQQQAASSKIESVYPEIAEVYRKNPSLVVHERVARRIAEKRSNDNY